MNRRYLLLCLYLTGAVISRAQPGLQLQSASNYRLFFGSVPTLYDTGTFHYSAGRSYDTLDDYWAYDSVTGTQQVPVGSTIYQQFQTFDNNGMLSTRGKMATSTTGPNTTFSASKDSFIYNIAGQLSMIKSMSTIDPNLTSWSDVSRKTYYYTGAFQDSSITETSYQSAWYVTERIVNSFNGSILATRRRWYNEFVVAGQWDLTLMTKSNYNSLGQRASDSNFSLQNNVWTYTSSTQYQYNANGELAHISGLGPQNINSNFYLLGEETDVSYDASHRKVQELSQGLYLDNVWRNYTRRTWTYSNTSFPDTYMQESWDDAHQQWAVQQWSSGGITAGPDEIKHYYYGVETSVNEPGRPAILVTISPNPATDMITLSFGEAPGRSCVARLIDVEGRIAFQQTVPPDATKLVLPVSFLSSGTYYLHINYIAGSLIRTVEVIH